MSVDGPSPSRQGYRRFWDMPFGGTAPGKHIPKGFATFAVGLVRGLLTLPFRFTVEGRETLADLISRTGVVVISNHTSFLDVVFLYLAIRPAAWPRFMARETLFEGKPRILGWALARLGVFPVKRDSADRTAIKRAARFLKDREAVAIMPEGTRRGKSDRAPELHGGAALVARMGRAPLLPATVRNAELIKEKGRFLRFPKVSVEFGNPIAVGDFDFLPKEKRLDACTWYAMRECFALSARCCPDEVDMQALFPDSDDYTALFEEHPIPRHSPADFPPVEEEPCA